jgi:two-component system response regulator AtoC
MMTYEWPGNIRELQNVIEYASVLGVGDTITFDDLTPEIRGEEPPTVKEEAQTAWEIEHEQLLEALRKARGKREEAAEMLGISRTTLWRKLKEHKIT